MTDSIPVEKTRMSWPKPEYSRSNVNKAGEILAGRKVSIEDFIFAIEVLNNWRSCHSYPINTFQATLRTKLKGIDKNAIVAQRLKRTPSIVAKLRGQEEKNQEPMKLSRMQDIGGLRAVVKNLVRVRRLEQSYENSRFQHVRAGYKDYIASPKESGYRGIHLIYKYKNKGVPDYDGLRVELQIRTRVQHAWATAVEIMGTFLQENLKASEGPEEWLDFFALTGAAFAHYEGTPPVPGYENLTDEDTYKQMLNEAARLNVRDRLAAFAVAGDQIWLDRKPGSFHLVVLRIDDKTVSVETFPKSELMTATAKYDEIEKAIADGLNAQAVLVSAGPIKSLKRAYPNFFLDTQQFIRYLGIIERALIKSLHGSK